jgi:hypothetical protein
MRSAAKHGGRGVGRDDFLSTTMKLRVRRPLHHPTLAARASGGPPPPLSRGRMHFRALPFSQNLLRVIVTPRQIPRTKKGKRSAERRIQPWRHHTDAAACSAEHARLSALHRGSRLGDRTPPLSFGPRFTLWRIVTSAHYAGLRTLSAAKFSQTPGRPVLMPAGSMPEAARERSANPRAGTALAPYVGSHPDTSRTERVSGT